MARKSKPAAHLALALGLVGVACSQPRTEPVPAEEARVPTTVDEPACIEGHVERRGEGPVRIIATDKSDARAFFSTISGAGGHYRLGPLPPADYDVNVMTVFQDPAHVDNFRSVSATASTNRLARIDFSLPGRGSLIVGFSGDRGPGTLVTEVRLFAGSEHDISMARYRELQREQSRSRLGRNTISADDPTTIFRGLSPGAYTACAVINFGGDDLRATCDDAEVPSDGPAELTLDFPLG